MALALPQPDMSSLMAALAPPPTDLATGYTDDYTPGPSLSKEEINDAASELVADHSVRIAQARKYSSFLEGNDPGHFEEDEELLEQGVMETMPLLGAREDFEFRVGYLAGHDIYVKLLNRDMIDGQEAMMVEDTVLYHLQCEERQYSRRHRSDLGLARAQHLCRFGALVGIDILDPYDTRAGLEMDLLDPLTIFPVWGGAHGLLECYRVFEDTNENIIGTFGGPVGSADYRRLEEKVKKSASKTKRGKRTVMNRNQLRSVTQVWTYDEMVVILDEEQELVRVKHDYRRVPITIRVGAFDMPVGVNIGMEEQYADPREYSTDWGTVTVSNSSMDIARQWKPPAYRTMQAHIIAEAVAGRQLSTLKASWDPHMIEQFDPTMDRRKGEKRNILPGETTEIPLPGTLTVVMPTVDPITAQAVAANLQANATGGGFLTQARLGAIPPQTSGSAMAKLQTLGGAGDIGLLRTMTGFIRDRAEWRLELLKTFGDAMGTSDGVLQVPNRGYGGFHLVTPDVIERSGTEIDAELYMPSEDVNTAQWVSTLRLPSPLTNKPIISDSTARRRLRVAPDIEREEARIEREILNAQPPIAQQHQMAQLQRDIEDARAAGDDESEADLMVSALELQHMHDMAVAEGMAAPPPGGQQQPGLQQQQAAPPRPPGPVMPGTSLPEQGIGVGVQGGRPTGAQGPTPITPPPPTVGGGGF